jgi:1L-myo-inositol 1-phosphate cytidylyltransferase / CDP-L-myo-inositol myo-inositolphosphotransferase
MSKPQDGFVSRFLNRPISRRVSRVLLKFPVHPNTCTMSVFVLSLIACPFLALGGYTNVIIGAAIFQLYSILDGCDGEIARAKGLESQFGERLDHFCDFLASILFILALSFGLHRLIEGIFCAAFVAANELFLRIGQSAAPATSIAPDAAYYPRHREMIERSGLRSLGPLIWWIAQLTRRDVVTLLFLVLAIVDLAPWILHLWALFTAVSLVFSGLALAKPRR